jgi:hypothetical protein
MTHGTATCAHPDCATPLDGKVVKGMHYRCYLREWRRSVGGRAKTDEARENDRQASRNWKSARRERTAFLSGAAGKTPGNQIGPASGATDRDRGNQEASS